MSMEPKQKKLETRDEEKKGPSAPDLAPGLLQVPDNDWPRAGPSTESLSELQASAADEPSDKCLDNLLQDYVVRHEQELEPVLVREEDKAEENEEWACGGSAEALLATLDALSTIKPELVLGPRVQQAPDIAFMDQGSNVNPCTSSEASAAEGVRDESPEEDPSLLALSTCSGGLDNPVYKHPSKQQSTATNQQSVVGGWTISCGICGKLYSDETNLNEHLKTHKPHQCDVCKRTYGSKSELEIHYRTHTGEKPHSCDVCGKSFSLAGNLNIHRRIHTGEKPHVCKICNKRFNYKTSFDKHVRIHTGARPYECNVCGRRFRARYNLSRHIGGVHRGVTGNSSRGPFDDVH